MCLHPVSVFTFFVKSEAQICKFSVNSLGKKYVRIFEKQ